MTDKPRKSGPPRPVYPLINLPRTQSRPPPLYPPINYSRRGPLPRPQYVSPQSRIPRPIRRYKLVVGQSVLNPKATATPPQTVKKGLQRAPIRGFHTLKHVHRTGSGIDQVVSRSGRMDSVSKPVKRNLKDVSTPRSQAPGRIHRICSGIDQVSRSKSEASPHKPAENDAHHAFLAFSEAAKGIHNTPWVEAVIRPRIFDQYPKLAQLKGCRLPKLDIRTVLGSDQTPSFFTTKNRLPESLGTNQDHLQCQDSRIPRPVIGTNKAIKEAPVAHKIIAASHKATKKATRAPKPLAKPLTILNKYPERRHTPCPHNFRPHTPDPAVETNLPVSKYSKIVMIPPPKFKPTWATKGYPKLFRRGRPGRQFFNVKWDRNRSLHLELAQNGIIYLGNEDLPVSLLTRYLRSYPGRSGSVIRTEAGVGVDIGQEAAMEYFRLRDRNGLGFGGPDIKFPYYHLSIGIC